MKSVLSPKERTAIANVSNFFGARPSLVSYDEFLTLCRLQLRPNTTKAKLLERAIRHLYQEDLNGLLILINLLLRTHTLDSEELDVLNSDLTILDFQIKDDKVLEIAPEDYYIMKFEEALRRSEPRPAVEGERDGAIITLCEKISSIASEFCIVDFGCGPGRLVYGLNLLDKKVLSLMTFIGVDKDTECLKKIRQTIRDLDFHKKIKRYRLMTPREFFKTRQKADFIFMINVLHEIHFIDLPWIFEELEKKLKKGGHLLIHEMRELPKLELGFVTWEPHDFLEVFLDTSLTTHLHPYETKRGFPLVNVDLVKTKDKNTSSTYFRDICTWVYGDKLRIIESEIREIKQKARLLGKQSVPAEKYANLVILKDNIETQLKDHDIEWEWMMRCEYEKPNFPPLPRMRSDGEAFRFALKWEKECGYRWTNASSAQETGEVE